MAGWTSFAALCVLSQLVQLLSEPPGQPWSADLVAAVRAASDARSGDVRYLLPCLTSLPRRAKMQRLTAGLHATVHRARLAHVSIILP